MSVETISLVMIGLCVSVHFKNTLLRLGVGLGPGSSFEGLSVRRLSHPYGGMGALATLRGLLSSFLQLRFLIFEVVLKCLSKIIVVSILISLRSLVLLLGLVAGLWCLGTFQRLPPDYIPTHNGGWVFLVTVHFGVDWLLPPFGSDGDH